ncbi:uncharacterized protein PFL1_04554 [Pseudozyma flocculosa PF-1]|uniref:Related to Monocarboxylate transporter n=2 Tax=Pseudozyma flocculosa TaxID=84751 RepID=A0A5C3F9D4_9BASI|nr:uncharacterized protein PFL1_04554 [Pseudozyma flocculosa PF-1]EPQ27809.1 hypothetical protein PFL1_04554 [Pseudozyma flocculosa PF-1]SPO41063.1 related to Monocarboxylate transporter [Pseudozyma flocculosa]
MTVADRSRPTTTATTLTTTSSSGTDIEAAPGSRALDGHSSPTSGSSDPNHVLDTTRSNELSIRDEKQLGEVDDDASQHMEKDPDAGITFPEGGLRAWLSVLGGFWCTFITFGYLNSFGVFEDYYLQSFLSDKSSSQVAWIGAFQYFLLFAMGGVSGRLFDLGFFRPTFTFGCVLLVVSQMLLSLCTEYYQFFLCQGVGLGLSFGIVFNMGINCPAHHFLQRRAMAFGLIATGSSTGGIIFPIMIRRLIPIVGFGWTMRIVGFFALFAVISASLCLSTRLPPSIDVSDKSKGGWKQVKWVDLDAFRVPAYSWFVFACTVVMLGLYMPFTYMDVFSQVHNVPASGYYLSILNASSMFGRALPGLVADKVGRINVLLPHIAISAVLLIFFPLCVNVGGLVAFAVIFGFTSGCYVSLIPACCAQLGSTATVGTRNGMMFMVGSLGGLFGTPISGAILGDAPDYDWWGTAAFSFATVLVGSFAIATSRYFALNKQLRGKI